MVPGKEVTLMTQAAVLKVNKSTGANQPQLTVSSDAHLVADIDSFRKIYDYYGGKKTLHQILFAQDEASIALPDAGKKEDPASQSPASSLRPTVTSSRRGPSSTVSTTRPLSRER